MKDGAEGDTAMSRVEVVDVGHDDDGEVITLCVVVPADTSLSSKTSEPRLTKNQRTLFGLLHGAGTAGLTKEEWNGRTRAEGIGTSRRAEVCQHRRATKVGAEVRSGRLPATTSCDPGAGMKLSVGRCRHFQIAPSPRAELRPGAGIDPAGFALGNRA